MSNVTGASNPASRGKTLALSAFFILLFLCSCCGISTLIFGDDTESSENKVPTAVAAETLLPSSTPATPTPTIDDVVPLIPASAPLSRTSTPEPVATHALTVSSASTVTSTTPARTSTPIPTKTPISTNTPRPTATPIPPTPVPPPQPTPTPAPSCTVEAWVDNPNPPQNSTITVFGKLTCDGAGVANASMHTVWHYRTTTVTCDSTTDGDGVAACQRHISRAKIGYFVRIDVAITWNGRTYYASTGFTPQ